MALQQAKRTLSVWVIQMFAVRRMLNTARKPRLHVARPEQWIARDHGGPAGPAHIQFCREPRSVPMESAVDHQMARYSARSSSFSRTSAAEPSNTMPPVSRITARSASSSARTAFCSTITVVMPCCLM